jgi:hypothetical protein
MLHAAERNPLAMDMFFGELSIVSHQGKGILLVNASLSIEGITSAE